MALLIKAFLLQAFYIPSESMTETLHVDDRVLVNKLSYRLGDVDRGDIVVFHKPENAPGNIEDFIKRVVALPGETITFVNGDVFIDGQLLTEPYVDGSTSPPVGAILSEGCAPTHPPPTAARSPTGTTSCSATIGATAPTPGPSVRSTRTRSSGGRS